MIFFITLFRYFTIVLFFTLHFFSFSQGMQTRERAHCARSVFPFIKKKKKVRPVYSVLYEIFGLTLTSLNVSLSVDLGLYFLLTRVFSLFSDFM